MTDQTRPSRLLTRRDTVWAEVTENREIAVMVDTGTELFRLSPAVAEDLAAGLNYAAASARVANGPSTTTPEEG